MNSNLLTIQERGQAILKAFSGNDLSNMDLVKGGIGSGKYSHIKLHSDNNVAIHQSAEHIAAHAGIGIDDYKKLKSSEKQEHLVKLKNAMHADKMKKR